MSAPEWTNGRHRDGPYCKTLAAAIFRCTGPVRLEVFGGSPELARVLIDLGCTIVPGNSCQGAVDAGIVLCELAELDATLSSVSSQRRFPVLFADVTAEQSYQPDGETLRSRVERTLIAHGYLKHAASMALFDYSQLDSSMSECWALFEDRLPELADSESNKPVSGHAMDMLRIAGAISDAHIVRYQLAANCVRPGDKIIDAACGLGYGSHVLASVSPASMITGIDVSDQAVTYAKCHYGNDHVNFLTGSLPDALNGYDDSSVDFVVSLEALEHVPEPEQLLASFHRILKPGGRIVVSVPNDWADESGKDPNPHHLHVYRWDRLNRELSQYFIVENAWALTASGCKTGPDHIWRAQPRKLEPVALELAPTTEGEWWVVCATKSPLAPTTAAYEETIHRNFNGTSHLVDFAHHYDRPWIVHSMVELPWRLRNKIELVALAEKVLETSSLNTADYGAGLAVKGWRLLEDESAVCAAAEKWLAHAEHYLTSSRDSTNPHVRRWCVSLDYLTARFHESRGANGRALDAYSCVIAADILTITPTLGTKVTDAALRAGILSFQMDDNSRAISIWKAGLDAAFGCLHTDPIEFVGNHATPFIFSMNDLVEIADGATRLANAIHIVSSNGFKGRAAVARLLGSVAQSSLRSAFSKVQAMAEQRGIDLKATEDQLSRTQVALEETQALARARDKSISDLSLRLDATQAALDDAQRLAISRFEEVATLSTQIDKTQAALDASQALALGRANEITALLEKLDKTQAALDASQALALGSANESATLSEKLDKTQAALDASQALALGRANEIAALAEKLDKTQAALAQTQELAFLRATEIDTLQAALTHAQGLVAERDAKFTIAEEQIAAQSVRIDDLAVQLRTAVVESSAASLRYNRIINSPAWKVLSALRLAPRRHPDDR
jgi:2-polyprenyl-3-methyl-5-hydroxy-6-metoxy-1,4-benzoquinol methylase